jgi:quinol-cytochrome oxidoreductase complex cytochrome b subunit
MALAPPTAEAPTVPQPGERYVPESLLRRYSDEAARIDAERRAKKKMNRAVEGYPFWPHEVVRDTIFILFFTGIIFYLCAFIPYYLEAPANPGGQPAVILPDWYLLWSYGILKIADDVTFCSGWAGTTLGIPGIWTYACGDIVSLPVVGLLNAKTWALVFHAFVLGPVILVPLLDRGHSRRPVESPFWASAGLAGVVYILMVSIYSVNTVIQLSYPIFGQEYFTWTRDYVQLFHLDLLALMANLLPLLIFFVCYIPLKIMQRQHGYEAKLNYSYYNTR